MPPMMKNRSETRSENTAAEIIPPADDTAWEELYDHLRRLAFRRSAPMLDMDVEEGERFDRGVRSLRTLMGAAEIARRMKTYDEKETTSDGGQEGDAVSDDRIRDVKRRIMRQIDRIEREDQETGEPPAEPGGEDGGAQEDHAGRVPGAL